MIQMKDQHKTIFIFPWGTFAYKNIPFVFKNDGDTCQRAMIFYFNDLKDIVEAYLDDLTTHYRKRYQHLLHLVLVFDICCHYRIYINVFFS
jgi:hypothetical protein